MSITGLGLTAVSGPCSSGYYCTSAAQSATPTDATGDICTVGHYCPTGTPVPVPCADGKHISYKMT